MKQLSILITISLFLFSCAREKTGSGDATDTSVDAKNCTYSVQPAFTTVNWTAYKTTARVGVGGTFTDLSITPGKEEGSVTEIMTNLSFGLDIASTSTKDTSRDRKIRQYFFGTMAGWLPEEERLISGTINTVQGVDTGGIARITLRMNDLENEVDAKYRLEGNKLILETSVLVDDWDASSSIDSLNSVCEDLHKGEDGVSKLWPDVDVRIESVLKKNCDSGVAQSEH